ncbi:MAG: hypothetical protein ACKPCM_15380 [Pseudanabaena sp.]
MKNPNFPQPQENSDGDPQVQTDIALVNFLKQNKPITPLPAHHFEQQLFAEISKYPQKSKNRSLKRWLPWTLLIPVAIATAIGFKLVNNRSHLQVATNSISEAERGAIEQSLINSWDAADFSVAQTSSMTTSTDTQLLMELSPLEYE